VYILAAGLVAFAVIAPYGNINVIDALFFGISACTESGLNPVDVKDLKTYQQLVIYIIPTISHMAVINIVVIVVRLHWFEQRLEQVAPHLIRSKARSAQIKNPSIPATHDCLHIGQLGSITADPTLPSRSSTSEPRESLRNDQCDDSIPERYADVEQGCRIAFNQNLPDHRADATTIYAPPLGGHHHKRSLSRARQNQPGSTRYLENDTTLMLMPHDTLSATRVGTGVETNPRSTARMATRASLDSRPRVRDHFGLEHTASMERVTSSVFVLGLTRSRSRDVNTGRRDASRPRAPYTHVSDLPQLSSRVTIGRNSQFHGLTVEERETLGGMEYRSLKLLLWISIGYFLTLHILGIICLIPWIQQAPAKYTDYLDEVGQNKIWWAFYSAQTMANNLGFTLTPDSMAHFRDATFPMIVMTFLAYAGYNFYPIFLRLAIWTFYKLTPKNSTLRGPLSFLLEHPRRCCMLLFPSRPTWILLGILLFINFFDVLLLIVLDLDNPSVTELPLARRILAAIFQAASSRHTGTSTFDLSKLNPAAQFSLLVMMYISVYPIALTIRASNTYEERSLGTYAPEQVNPNEESTGQKYIVSHMRNQLSFDLWYIFLGIFLICIAESGKIMDTSQPEFSVFPIFFEVTSAYCNVGLSLGHPAVQTSFSGTFSVYGKLIICAMMIRGRHRGLPYGIDRAIELPSERLVNDEDERGPSRRPLLVSDAGSQVG
ncbi:High-affinity potassium transport protein, partial [Fusarium culmorum]